MYLKIIDIRRENNLLYQYTSFMDALKVNIEYNMDYIDIKNLIEEKKNYITYNDIDIDKIKNCEIVSAFSDSYEIGKTYIYITSDFANKESQYEYIKISVELIYQSKYGEKKIRYVLFKSKEKST